MLLIVVAVVGAVEIYLRSMGLTPSYNDDEPLWAHARSQAYLPSSDAVVFTGSSRIKFDLDIATWEKLTGKKAIQLAMTGSNPLPVLRNLAEDEKFKGSVVVDVTEPLFFPESQFSNRKPKTRLAYLKDQTLAQRASFQINNPLEAMFVFLDQDNFSINAKLAQLQLPNRPGVFVMPAFPVGFDRCLFNEQSCMSPQFVADSNDHRKVINIWKALSGGRKGPPMTDSAILSVCNTVKGYTDMIRARGGNVFFVRTPSSGELSFGEKMGFPREKFWNSLLKVTNCQGFHFMDNPVTAGMLCPEDSHLTPEDAITYTRELVNHLNANAIFQTSITTTK